MPCLFPVLLLCLVMLHSTAAEPIDVLTFGDPASEQAHALVCEHGEVIRGGLDEPARHLLPREPASWDGGTIAFTVRVDARLPTYLTVRLWGGEANRNRLVLFVEGRQVGYRHLGDIEILDPGSAEPATPGRFFYRTTPLPPAMTAGHTTVRCELRASGPIWGYGRDFAQYQKPMAGASRALHRIYTHLDGCFMPPADERQGNPPEPTVRTSPGPEVIDQIRQRVAGSFTGLLNPKRALNQMEAHFLARARAATWLAGHDDPRVAAKVMATVDTYCARLRDDPMLIHQDPATWNSGWFGVGPLADAVRLLADQMKPFLDQPSPTITGSTRRDAWAVLFQTSRDWLRHNRRQYTNQAMIIDLNVYRTNRALRVVAPERAFVEADALRYVHEATGIRPWLGSDTPQGPSRPLGDGFMQLTAKGLTRELGYVGYYGEVLDWMLQILESTHDADHHGDPLLRTQIAKAAAARAWFRYPTPDEDGHRAMRIETVVGWRDDQFPAAVTYGMRSVRDGSCLALPATLRDPASIGAAQQQLADGQLYASLAEVMQERGLRATMGLLDVPAHHDWLLAQPASRQRLPLSPGAPDAVFSDEENGVIALAHGDERLFVSLYWRARHAVNRLARVHHLTPRYDRIAVVWQETRFEPSGHIWKRPDWVNFGFANGGPRYPGDLHSAHAGEELPIARVPDGLPFKPGQEHLDAGRGRFYRLLYGRYLIGMNMGATQPERLEFPDGVRQAPDLVSGMPRTADAAGGVVVPPRSTVVLVLPEKR